MNSGDANRSRTGPTAIEVGPLARQVRRARIGAYFLNYTALGFPLLSFPFMVMFVCLRTFSGDGEQAEYFSTTDASVFLVLICCFGTALDFGARRCVIMSAAAVGMIQLFLLALLGTNLMAVTQGNLFGAVGVVIQGSLIFSLASVGAANAASKRLVGASLREILMDQQQVHPLWHPRLPRAIFRLKRAMSWVALVTAVVLLVVLPFGWRRLPKPIIQMTACVACVLFGLYHRNTAPPSRRQPVLRRVPEKLDGGVLYLRRFKDDVLPPLDPRLALAAEPPRHFEEVVVAGLSLWGPVFALGREEDQILERGAFRVVTPSGPWEATFQELLGKSRTAAFLVGQDRRLPPNPDFGKLPWELGEVSRQAAEQKVMFVMPPNSSANPDGRIEHLAKLHGEHRALTALQGRDDALLSTTRLDGEVVMIHSRIRDVYAYEIGFLILWRLTDCGANSPGTKPLAA